MSLLDLLEEFKVPEYDPVDEVNQAKTIIVKLGLSATSFLKKDRSVTGYFLISLVIGNDL